MCMRGIWARIKEIVGYGTGDRRVQAKARVEEEVADPTNPVSEVTEDKVADTELGVREELGEYQPRRQRG